MHASVVRRAIAAARSVAAAAGLPVENVVVLQSSTKLTLRLLPCDVLARVFDGDTQASQREVELARVLIDADCPVGQPEPRVEPQAFHADGFAVTLWRFYDSADEVPPAEYASALHRLHAGMRAVQAELAPVPHVLDRIASARHLLRDRDLTPELPDDDRQLLTEVLRDLPAELTDPDRDQLLHGEPHEGNVLATAEGPLFIDLETTCRGPIEFDLAHAPAEADEHYPGADLELTQRCHLVVLAMVTTWRWDRDDQLPGGRRLAAQWLTQIRAGCYP